VKIQFVLAVAAAALSAVLAAPTTSAAALRPIWHPELVNQSLAAASAESTATAGGPSAASSPSGSPAVTTLAISAGGSTTCGPGWSYVAARINSYVTGNCAEGWSLTAGLIDWDSVHSEYWYGGAIGGAYAGCGWMRTQDLGGFSGYNVSTCMNRADCDFMTCDSGHHGYIYGGTDDGLTASSITGCDEWANYRPWSATPRPTDSLRKTKGWTNDLKVRYLAKLQYGGHRFYMVRDTTIETNRNLGNWVFIRDDCLS
jgi:hypothetical protein